MRVCGAEINTIEEVRKKNWLTIENLIFWVSDTDSGRATGKTLKHYYSERKDLPLKNVEYDIIDQLQDKRPKDFKIHGLRNLVRKIGEYIQRFGGLDYVQLTQPEVIKHKLQLQWLLGKLSISLFIISMSILLKL